MQRSDGSYRWSPRKRMNPLAALMFLCLVPVPCVAQADGEEVIFGTYREVPSEVLGEDRRILVHLPRGYAESDRTYPVIVKLHGAPLSFFAPISAGLDLLAESGLIPEVILVGVEQHGHWEVRPRDVGGPRLTVRAEEFLRFLVDDFLPFVDAEYRTKDLRILMGTYDCALFALYALAEAPESFNAYLTNSLRDIGRGGGSVLERTGSRLANGFDSPRFFYVTEWRDASGQTNPQVDRFLARLGAAAPSGLTWGSEVLEHPGHNPWTPYYAVEHGLRALFDGFKCPPEVLEEGLSGVQAHYGFLSRRFGVPFEIPEMVYNNVCDHLVEQHAWEEAIEALLCFRTAYRRSLNAAFRLARAYRGAGDFDRAIESYRVALEFENSPPFLGEELRRLEDSPAFAVERSILESGLDAGLRNFEDLRAENRGDAEFREGEFNEAGCRFLGRRMVPEAIAIFRMAVELFPESANAFDSLGEAFAASGDTTEAIENYRRSLALDPGNENAREMLRELGQPE